MVSASHLAIGVLGLQIQPPFACLLWALGIQTQALILLRPANVVPTEPSPQPQQ